MKPAWCARGLCACFFCAFALHASKTKTTLCLGGFQKAARFCDMLLVFPRRSEYPGAVSKVQPFEGQFSEHESINLSMMHCTLLGHLGQFSNWFHGVGALILNLLRDDTSVLPFLLGPHVPGNPTKRAV